MARAEWWSGLHAQLGWQVEEELILVDMVAVRPQVVVEGADAIGDLRAHLVVCDATAHDALRDGEVDADG